MTENEGILNEGKYIIDAKWWRSWMDYVGFGEVPRKHGEGNGHFRKERPNQMKNGGLLKSEYISEQSSGIELRDNLLEHYDYEAVPKRIFINLKAWYGCDYEIVRLLKYDPSQPPER